MEVASRNPDAAIHIRKMCGAEDGTRGAVAIQTCGGASEARSAPG
jgi:hypothetical protein